MNCSKCDRPIEDDSQYCRHCGTAVAPQPDEKEAGSELRKAAAPSGDAQHGPDVYRDPKHERQVWQGRPAWRSFWGFWMLWLVVSAICLVVSYKWVGAESWLFKTVLLLVAGAGVGILVGELLWVLGRRYRLTTQRLFVYRGILTRVTDQMELMRVDDVRLRQGIIDRIVNTGDIEVLGTDETDEDVTLESVGAPAEVAESLRLHVRGVRSKGTLLVENI
ncbi:MAG: PH domain-containing protein [Planctomycetota bacterium]